MSRGNGVSAWFDGYSVCYSSDGMNWENAVGSFPGGLTGVSMTGLDREYFKETGNIRYHGKFNSFTNTSIFTVSKTGQKIELQNVALNKNVSVSSVYSDYTGDRAVDGNNTDVTSRWVSGSVTESSPQWIEINLGNNYSIKGISFWTGGIGYNQPNNDFEFQYWNGSAWQTIFSETGNTEPICFKLFQPVNVSKVRLYITKVDNSLVRIFELEVYGELYTANTISLKTSQGDKPQLEIHPNPTTGMVYIDNYKILDGGLSIVSSSGIVVMTIKGNDLSGGIDIGHLPTGLYFLRGNSGNNGVAVAKIIKQ
jgi:hypothetical protein